MDSNTLFCKNVSVKVGNNEFKRKFLNRIMYEFCYIQYTIYMTSNETTTQERKKLSEKQILFLTKGKSYYFRLPLRFVFL